MSRLPSHFCALFVVPFLFLFCLLCPFSLQILLARAERWGGDFSLRRRKSSLCHIIFLLFNVISRKWFFYQIFFPFCYVSISWWVKRGFGKILWCVGRPHKICWLLILAKKVKNVGILIQARLGHQTLPKAAGDKVLDNKGKSTHFCQFNIYQRSHNFKFEGGIYWNCQNKKYQFL